MVPDRLMDMRAPEPIQVLYRMVYGAQPLVAPAAAPRDEAPRPAPPRPRSYQRELDDRRRQERVDEDLARRLQLATIFDNDDDNLPMRRRPGEETYGIGNAAGHFMNDDFVQNATNVIMDTFGDANLGRRGERASGRRRRPRESNSVSTGQQQDDAGLAPGFLGDESVIGVMVPGRRSRGAGR
ncbi:hypothetical protein LTR62_007582 [Meristemomyces frigidus]|uniref:Uncharacterized protein n=1 Tax=Meristemomyces frigidus TaxID=1508187 RepID=A0AAN7YHS9_9PEZI|nr:hypothetical protein LTR62_007582 [Meristemomyces frigidus]